MVVHVPTQESLNPWVPTASAIVDAGLWCVIEVCVDTAADEWEPRLLICHNDTQGILRAVAEWIAGVPTLSARIAGYTRDRLRRVDWAPIALCHVA